MTSEMSNSLNNVDTSSFKEKIQSAVETIKNKLESLKMNVIDTQKSSAQLELIKYKISEIEEQLDKAKNGEIHLSVKNGLELESQLERLNAQKEKLEQDDGKSTFFSKMSSSIKSVGNSLGTIRSKIKQVTSSTTGWKNGFNQINKVGVQVTNKIKQMGSGMENGLKQVLKYAGALFSLRSIYSTLSSCANSWLSSQNAQAQQLTENINYMKYAMGSAFAPVIEYVVNLVYKLMKAIQSIIYAITKVNIFANASADSYASMSDSASDTADSTKKTAKSLASVHSEINNVNSDSSSGSGSSGSSSTSPSFDLSSIDTTSSLFDAIENGDWYEVGEALSQKINDALDSIDWTSIQEKAKNIATNIGDFINGFVDGLDWNLLGTTVGNGIRTALIFANTLFTTVDFENIGKSIATFLNSAIKTVLQDNLLGETIGNGIESAIDFAYGLIDNINFKDIADSLMLNINTAIEKIDTTKLGKTVADLITVVPSFMISAIENIDWGNIAEKISAFLVSAMNELEDWFQSVDWRTVGKDLYNDIKGFIQDIDWSSLATHLFTLLGQAIGAAAGMLASFIGNAIRDAVTAAKEYFQGKIEECGGNVVEGILKGIFDAIKGIGTWISDNIFQPFIDGFKSVFGINSPSTVMAEMGGYLVQGLFNGLSNIWETVAGIFTGLGEKISGKFQDIKTAVSGKVEEIKTNLSTTWDNIKTTASTAWDNVKTNVTDKFSKAKDTLGTTASNIGTNLSTKFSTVKDNAKTWGSNISEKLQTGMSGKISSIQTSVSNITSKIKGMNIASSATSWGKDLVNNFASGIKNAIGSVTSAVQSVASKVKSLLGFSEPEEGPLSDFHTYMPDMLNLMAKGIHENVGKVTDELNDLTTDMSYSINTNGISDDLISDINLGSMSIGKIEPQNEALYQNLLDTINNTKQPVNITLNVGQDKLGTILLEDLRQRVHRSGKNLEAIVG